jgi:pimeloyl-ACP methyl ester carboxylesterase
VLSSRFPGRQPAARRSPREMEDRAMVTTGYLERDAVVGNLKLHYQEWGNSSAPAILMLHGFGVSGHMFDEFAERMQDQYRLIAIDQRGHGDSDWSEEGDYTRQAFVADVEGFAAALGLERFILMGHSMGGLNAVAYTVKNPSRVRALVLVDVGPESSKEGVDNIVRFTRGPDELEFEEFVEMAHRFNPRRTLDNIRERMRHRLKPLESGKWTWKFDKRFREGREELRVGSELSNDDTWQLFRSIQAPALLVRGAESDVLTAEVADRVVAEMPRARLVVVPSAGHSVPGDNPDDFTAGVREFLGDVERGQFEPVAASEPPPLGDLLEEHEAKRRRGIGFLPLVLVGATAMVAVGGGTYAWKRRRDKKAETKKAQRNLKSVATADIEKARQRAGETAAALAAVGKASVGRARTTLEGVDLDRARSAAQDLLSALGESAKHTPETAKAVVQKADPKKLAARNGKAKSGASGMVQSLVKAAPFLAVAARPLTRRRKRQHRVMRWRH